MRFKEYLKEEFEIGDRVKFDGSEWEVFELNYPKIKIVSLDGKEIVDLYPGDIDKINEVLDYRYAPGGEYYRAPEEFKKDKDTGVSFKETVSGNKVTYVIKGKEDSPEVNKFIEKIFRQYPPEGYGTSTQSTKDDVTIITRSRSSD